MENQTQPPLTPVNLKELQAFEYTLKQPIVITAGDESKNIPTNRLTKLSIRRYNAGMMVNARAKIARHPDFGPMLVADQFTLFFFLLPQCVTGHDAFTLPMNWVFQLSDKDFSALTDVLEAMTQDFESVEAYKADLKAKQREAMREATGMGEQPGGEAFQAQP